MHPRAVIVTFFNENSVASLYGDVEKKCGEKDQRISEVEGLRHVWLVLRMI
jgi:ribosomal silencing factor RsfS